MQKIETSGRLVLVWSAQRARYEDRGSDLISLAWDGRNYVVVFGDSRKRFTYGRDKILLVAPTAVQEVPQGAVVEVDGQMWDSALRLEYFDAIGNRWVRVHYPTQVGESSRTYEGHRVRLLSNARSQARVGNLMNYFESIVNALDEDDPLRGAFAQLGYVYPESALAAYLNGAQLQLLPHSGGLIFPFAGNLSQRDALEQALTHQISVIEGPPGTGKTQTILNLIANILQDPNSTIGVVSFNNAAVDNVYEKLSSEGLSFIAAPLGNKDRWAAFFESQGARSSNLESFLKTATASSELSIDINEAADSVHRVYKLEREIAQNRATRDRLREELKAFSEQIPVDHDPLLPRRVHQWTAGRVMNLLVELEIATLPRSRSRDMAWAFRRRWRHGIRRGMDSGSPGFATALQRVYLNARLGELEKAVAERELELAQPKLAHARQNMQRLSHDIIDQTLARRYQNSSSRLYDPETLWKQRDEFSRDYPVLLSTCHSLPMTVGKGRLLDYLIIDEASQVNLAVAVLAMSRARRVVVVGDTRQLPHIPADVGGVGPGPGAQAYDYVRHSILSSLMEVYGDSLPRTMLREHYRSDPRIIDFCNRLFYRGQLIPMKERGTEQALTLVHTVPGQHARAHIEGGRTNQREAEVVQELMPELLEGVDHERVGIISPFRRQAGLLASLIPEAEADTVHKFQGREKDTIVFSAVVDQSHDGTQVARFADDARLINVAVSRAQKRFVLVANPALPDSSRHLNELAAYIERHDPEAVRTSRIVSVFDVLYTEYAEALRHAASRMKGRALYASEEAAWNMLEDVLEREEFRHLQLSYQVLLKQLLPRDASLSGNEALFVRRRSSVDFVVSSRVTSQVWGVIEVDGFSYHQDDSEQLRRDRMKDAILARHGVRVLRLPTTGSGEVQKVVEFLAGEARVDSAFVGEPA